MTNYVKSNRLHARSWLALSLLGCFALSAKAADVPIPKSANGAVSNPNYLEYIKTGNTYTWSPVGTTTPPGSGTVSFPSTSTVSDVTPKMTTTGDLPYQHKGGAAAKVTISTGIDKVKVAAAAASAAASAAALQVKPGNPYVQVGALACMVFCVPLADALIRWGIDKLKDNGDGTFSAVVPDPSVIAEVSDGKQYSYGGATWFATASAACRWWASVYPGAYGVTSGASATGQLCTFQYKPHGSSDWRNESVTLDVMPSSSCPSGSPVANGVCGATASQVEKPLQEIFKSNIVDKPWSQVNAELAAALISATVGGATTGGIYQSGKDIFTDGTSNTITGPDLVPIGQTTVKTPINVLPGTTTPAPPGHTGPTESGTQTSTSTSTATNTFNPGTSGTGGGSGSSGSGSGPSMTTGTKTETKTSITNNITNNTSTSVTTHVETKDDAPKEPEKDFCEKNPDALACAEADTPEQDVPKRTVDISYKELSLFGSGSCPADSYMTTHGQSLKVWDWEASCDAITDYLKPILLACCAFSAFVIVSGGSKE